MPFRKPRPVGKLFPRLKPRLHHRRKLGLSRSPERLWLGYVWAWVDLDILHSCLSLLGINRGKGSNDLLDRHSRLYIAGDIGCRKPGTSNDWCPGKHLRITNNVPLIPGITLHRGQSTMGWAAA